MAKEKVVKDNSERWLLTYADLMNLLLILFILLFAYSQVDTQKFQQLSQSFSSVFGLGDPPSAVQGGSSSGNSLVDFPAIMPSPVIPSQYEEQQVEGIANELSGLVEAEGLEGNVDVKLQERGVVISIRAQLIFRSGSAEVEKSSAEDIIKIGRDILSKIPDKYIRVEGHTDDVPIKTSAFPSNWELSGARANNVLKLLVEQGGVNPKMISFIGYGENQPRVPNDSDANRAKNRRVDIVILRDASSLGEAGADTGGMIN